MNEPSVFELLRFDCMSFSSTDSIKRSWAAMRDEILLCILLHLNLGQRSLFVCVEVLRPSQPNGVMSSAVSLPNHTFTGQA